MPSISDINRDLLTATAVILDNALTCESAVPDDIIASVFREALTEVNYSRLLDIFANDVLNDQFPDE